MIINSSNFKIYSYQCIILLVCIKKLPKNIIEIFLSLDLINPKIIFNCYIFRVLLKIPVLGEILSSSLTIAAPCFSVHILIGDPPPI